MAKSHITWTRSPEELADEVDNLGRLLQTEVGQRLARVQTSAQADMREKAAWNNISGNARRGLRVVAVPGPDFWEMFFIHSVEYGKFLELANGGKYAIVWPTLTQTVPKVRSALKGLI